MSSTTAQNRKRNLTPKCRGRNQGGISTQFTLSNRTERPLGQFIDHGTGDVNTRTPNERPDGLIRQLPLLVSLVLRLNIYLDASLRGTAEGPDRSFTCQKPCVRVPAATAKPARLRACAVTSLHVLNPRMQFERMYSTPQVPDLQTSMAFAGSHARVRELEELASRLKIAEKCNGGDIAIRIERSFVHASLPKTIVWTVNAISGTIIG